MLAKLYFIFVNTSFIVKVPSIPIFTILQRFFLLLSLASNSYLKCMTIVDILVLPKLSILLIPNIIGPPFAKMLSLILNIAHYVLLAVLSFETQHF